MTQSARWIASVFVGVSLFASAVAVSQPIVDGDADGIGDERDDCPYTQMGTVVESTGCARFSDDADADGVNDADDACPYSPAGAKIDATGCARDTDFDGIADGLDACPSTTLGLLPDGKGCAQGEKASVAIATRSVDIPVKPVQSDEAAAPAKPPAKPKSAPVSAAAPARVELAKPSGSVADIPTPKPKKDPVLVAPAAGVAIIATDAQPKAQAAARPLPAATPSAPAKAPPPEVVKAPAATLSAKERERRAAAAIAGPVEDQSLVRPPSTTDRIQAEKPVAATRASQRAAPAPSSKPTNPEPAKPRRIEDLPDAVVLREATAAPVIIAPTPAPASVPDPVARPAPAETAVPVPAPKDSVEALLASLKEEEATAPAAAPRGAAAATRADAVVRYSKLGGLELGSEDISKLAELAARLKPDWATNPAMTLQVRGFTASSEDASLAERRLALVRAVLIGRGVPPNRVVPSTAISGSPRVEVRVSR